MSLRVGCDGAIPSGGEAITAAQAAGARGLCAIGWGSFASSPGAPPARAGGGLPQQGHPDPRARELRSQGRCGRAADAPLKRCRCGNTLRHAHPAARRAEADEAVLLRLCTHGPAPAHSLLALGGWTGGLGGRAGQSDCGREGALECGRVGGGEGKNDVESRRAILETPRSRVGQPGPSSAPHQARSACSLGRSVLKAAMTATRHLLASAMRAMMATS